MIVINRIRLYHAVLAILAILAYATGEVGIIHAWIGYGVAGIILLRLIWALGGERQFGLMRFYPSFVGLSTNNFMVHPLISKILLLGIMTSMLAATLTGITMDSGKTIGLASANIIAVANAEDDEDTGHVATDENGEGEESGLKEAHELFANLMLFFVGLHVTYLLMFKRPLARFMLFVPEQPRKS